MKRVIIFGVLLFSALALTGFAMGGHGEFRKNPVKAAIWMLDFKLDLSDAQEKELKGILEPAFAEFKAERGKALDKPEELIAKIKEGKLEKADIIRKMEKRREFVATHQEKAAEIILKAYQVLNGEQREKLASLIQEHLDKFLH